MNVNRNNYEEFFILYLDNELGSEERRMVEDFVAQNPDLKDELEILQQSKFTPETGIVFNGKEELMHSDGGSINLTNYEEWLVLCTDNELNNEQAKELDQFISRHPFIQKELRDYQHSKLVADETIVFPDKSGLYRKEEKIRTIRWWRVAAAAVLLLMAGVTYILVNRNPGGKQGPELVNKPADNQSPAPANVAVDKKADKSTTTPAIANNAAQLNPANVKDKEIAVKTIKNRTKGTQRNVELTPTKDDNLAIENTSNQLPNREKGTGIGVHPLDKVDESTNNAKGVTNLANTSYNNSNVAGANPDASFASLEEGGKNKKNRGLFRKAVRFFEKNTNINATDDDRLLVAGLAIKLK